LLAGRGRGGQPPRPASRPGPVPPPAHRNRSPDRGTPLVTGAPSAGGRPHPPAPVPRPGRLYFCPPGFRRRGRRPAVAPGPELLDLLRREERQELLHRQRLQDFAPIIG